MLCARARSISLRPQFGVRLAIPEVLRGLHKAGGIDLPTLNGDESWTLPIPARFVVDRNGVIVYSEINPPFRSAGHTPGARLFAPATACMRGTRSRVDVLELTGRGLAPANCGLLR